MEQEDAKATGGTSPPAEASGSSSGVEAPLPEQKSSGRTGGEERGEINGKCEEPSYCSY